MKKSTIIVILIFVFAIVVAFKTNQSYALTDDSDKKMNVYLSNIKISQMQGNVYVPESPEVSDSSVKAFDVIIGSPNDYVTFTFDIVNNGDIGIEIDSVVKEMPKCFSIEYPEIVNDATLVCNNLDYSYFYTSSNDELSKNDVIEPHTKENITIKIGMKKESNIELNGEVQVVLYDTEFVFRKEQS